MSKVYDNSGALFPNDRKEADNHPDRTGSALIGGVEYWVNGWIKEGSKGKFLSLSFKQKDQQKGSTNKIAPKRAENPDADIPW
jgi:hypothetical protein